MVSCLTSHIPEGIGRSDRRWSEEVRLPGRVPVSCLIGLVGGEHRVATFGYEHGDRHGDDCGE